MAVLVVNVGVALLDSKANNASLDWIWRGGKADGFRNFRCRLDKTLHPRVKTGLLIWFATFFAFTWLAIPTR